MLLPQLHRLLARRRRLLLQRGYIFILTPAVAPWWWPLSWTPRPLRPIETWLLCSPSRLEGCEMLQPLLGGNLGSRVQRHLPLRQRGQMRPGGRILQLHRRLARQPLRAAMPGKYLHVIGWDQSFHNGWREARIFGFVCSFYSSFPPKVKGQDKHQSKIKPLIIWKGVFSIFNSQFSILDQ